MSKRSNPETRLQIVVVEYLNLVLPPKAVFWAVLNERKETAARGALMNAMGRHPGASDLMVLYEGVLRCIELKTERNRAYGTRKTYQTEDQKAFQGRAERAGAWYAVCRNTDEVGEFLASHGVPLRLSRWTKQRRVA